MGKYKGEASPDLCAENAVLTWAPLQSWPRPSSRQGRHPLWGQGSCPGRRETGVLTSPQEPVFHEHPARGGGSAGSWWQGRQSRSERWQQAGAAPGSSPVGVGVGSRGRPRAAAQCGSVPPPPPPRAPEEREPLGEAGEGSPVPMPEHRAAADGPAQPPRPGRADV